MTRLAGRIRKARLLQRMSQRDLAVRIGVTRGAVANWESANATQPATERLQRIAHATSVNFEWLATGRGASVYRTSLDDIAAADVEVVEDPMELRLLRCFRAAPQRHHHGIIASLEAKYAAGKRSAAARNGTFAHTDADGLHR